MRRVSLGASVLAAAVLAACGASAAAQPAATPAPPATLTIDGKNGVLLRLSVQIASTPEARATGLMHVTHLSDTAGMVFEFPTITSTAFWMKDTPIPLDIAFWDSTGTIIDVQTMQPCVHDPCALYIAKGPYLGSVEVAAGVLTRAGVVPGDRASLSA